MQIMVKFEHWYLNFRMLFPVFSAGNCVDVLANYTVVTNFSLPKIKMLPAMLKILITGNGQV